MNLDLKLVLKAGVIWGIVGVALLALVTFFGSYIPFEVDGLSLGTYAMLFAGVHFVARNETMNIIVGIVGGMLAGLIAAVLLFVAGFLLPGAGFSFSNTATIVGALAAGIAGAIGMEIIRRV